MEKEPTGGEDPENLKNPGQQVPKTREQFGPQSFDEAVAGFVSEESEFETERRVNELLGDPGAASAFMQRLKEIKVAILAMPEGERKALLDFLSEVKGWMKKGRGSL